MDYIQLYELKWRICYRVVRYATSDIQEQGEDQVDLTLVIVVTADPTATFCQIGSSPSLLLLISDPRA